MQGERLKRLYEAAGYDSLAEFAARAGVPYQTAQKHVQRNSIPQKWAPAYIAAARATGADLAWLLTGMGRQPRQSMRAVIDRTAPAMSQSETGSPIERSPAMNWTDATLPVREVIEVAGGGFMFTGSVLENLRRPGDLAPEVQAFCIYMPNDEMEPRYERGDRLLVNQAVPPAPGRDVLLLRPAENGGQEFGIVRRLVAITPTTITVRSYNPAKTEELRRSDWPQMYRVDAARWR